MAYIGSTPTTQSFISGTDYFNGDGTTVAFTLTRTVASVNDIEAVVNNVVQQPNSAYTISSTTITFTSAPSSGTSNIYVRYLSTTTQAITPSQNSVGTSQLGTITNITSGNTALTLQTGLTPTTGLTVNTVQGVFVPNCFGVGGATPATSGAGISFPATQSASSDANTLDDYEEGNYTITDTSGAGLSITTTFAKYTKIGRQVTVYFQCTFPSTSSTAAVQLGGLPFVTSSYSAGVFGFNSATTADRSFLFQNGVAYIQIRDPYSNRTNVNYSSAEIIGMGTYIV
jgi:hypothetical protein